MYRTEVIIDEQQKKEIKNVVQAIKTIHFGENRYMNFRYFVDEGDEYYRGMNLLDFEKLCTFCLHEFQDMLGENNSPETVRNLDLFIALLEQNLFDDFFPGSDDELFTEDMALLN